MTENSGEVLRLRVDAAKLMWQAPTGPKPGA
jgi:hypothetical protein